MVLNGYNGNNGNNDNIGNNDQQRNNSEVNPVSDCGEDTVVQAPSLEALAEAAVLKLLTGATKKRSWQGDKAHITHIVHAHLPHTVRQRMQERVLRDWRVYDTVCLRLLDLLFSGTTTSLRLVHVRTFYRDDLISLLPRLVGLKELSFQDSTWRLSRRQLGLAAQALTRMVQLRVVKLQYCGHNLLLATLGAHCPNLQVVDVLGSPGVDDEGVWGLVTVNHAHYDSLARHALAHSPKVYTHKPNVNASGCWLLAFRSLTSKMMVKMAPGKAHSMQVNSVDWKIGEDESNCADARTSSVGEMKGVVEKQDQEVVSWSPCCSSLAFLDLRSTGVTQVGVTVLTQALPVHARLASDAHTRPASDAHTRPASDAHTRPASDAHTRPASDGHTRTPSDVSSQLATVSHTCPVSNPHTRRTPETPTHRTPETPTHRTPETPTHRTPETPTHRTPETPTHRTPETPTHSTNTHGNSHPASGVQAMARMLQIPLTA